MQKPEPTQTKETRRFTDSVESYSTVIGPGISIRGELTGSDSVDVAGTLEGDSRVESHYRVREGARVAGRIEATSLVVAGEVSGPELVADKIEIGASARVQASLHAHVVAIAEGAVFDGGVHMRGGESGSGPTVFKEQRKPRVPDDSSQG
jgi:cytoskeletal protein CcmA (bactofilin family)